MPSPNRECFYKEICVLMPAAECSTFFIVLLLRVFYTFASSVGLEMPLKQKNIIRRIVMMSSKLADILFPNMELNYRDGALKSASNIVDGQRPPLASSFELLPSGRRPGNVFLCLKRTDPGCLLSHRP